MAAQSEPTTTQTPPPRLVRPETMVLVIMGIATNMAVGALVHTLKLPVYLDAIGTIMVAILGGWRPAVVAGVGSFLIGGVLLNPVLPWFSFTQAAIAAFAHFAARNGWYRTMPRAVGAGVLLGVVAGVVSAPVIVYLFGGITGSGASLVVAFLLASGQSIAKSVVLSGLASEPLDKLLQTLIAIWILRGLPLALISRFGAQGPTALGKAGR